MFDYEQAAAKIYGSKSPGLNYVEDVRQLVGCSLRLDRIATLYGYNVVYNVYIELTQEDIIQKIPHFSNKSEVVVTVKKSLVDFAKKELSANKNEETGEVTYARILIVFDKEKFIEWWISQNCPLEIN
ncbi:MAG: hypothetical protein QXW79_04200 [Thermoplasmata archaeon]